MIHAKFNQEIKGIRNYLSNHKILGRTIPLVLGILALLWFLVRVIPKPQRAAYPCMKAAYPLMSGLVIWLVSITGISASFRLMLKNLRIRKYYFAIGSLIILGIFSAIYFLNQETPLFAAEQNAPPVHISNVPFGTPQGIIPGRVVWSWDPAATNENCTNDLKNNDGYFLAKNNNQEVIDKMFAGSIRSLTNEKNQKATWDALFKYFNKKKGKGEVGYKNTETIFIKVNQGLGKVTNPDLTRKEKAIGYSETSPEIMLSVLKQLVYEAGVPQNKIIIADPTSHIYQDNYEMLHKEFPDVIYGDKSPETVSVGRTLLKVDTVPVIYYSDKGTVLSKTTPTECLWKEMETADYLINLAALKAHGCAGISMCAKNHFGSIGRPAAQHLHAALVGRGNDRPTRVNYGMYRVFVDLMGSKYLGGNTLIYIIDALWSGTEALETPVKWVMEPFNNDWPSSIFVSLDPVAIESVGFDFLRSEASVGSPLWKNRPNFAQGVDDYIHQAASSKNWPEGIIYDPDNSGKPIPSLGVHEHWNNPVEKKYSRDLGKNEGIELFRLLAKK
jgi:hypothetical protein